VVGPPRDQFVTNELARAVLGSVAAGELDPDMVVRLARSVRETPAVMMALKVASGDLDAGVTLAAILCRKGGRTETE
jgi:hypothetical protein